jgi:antitoxin MazE
MYNCFMKMRLKKWGNSLGVRLPKVFAVHMGMREGLEVNIELQADGIFISKTTASLDTLLEQITPQMLHEETDTGGATGNELW